MKSEGTKAWWHKLENAESALNMLFPKCSDDSYPHVMLRLNFAVTVCTIHLALLMKLKNNDPDSYDENFDIKCDEYINLLKELIPLAAAYRFEQLLGDTEAGYVGGILTHSYNFTDRTDELIFVDNFSG